MDRTFRGWFWSCLTLSFLSACFDTSTSAQTFTPGNLVVSRIGDGKSSLTSSGNAVYLDEYKPLARCRQQRITTTALRNLRGCLGHSRGQIDAIGERQCVLTFAGYQSAAAAGSNITFTTNPTDPRTIAVIDSSGKVDTSTTLGSAYSGKSVYSSISTDGNSFYAGGIQCIGSRNRVYLRVW